MTEVKRSIRFEDLGEPVQKLLRALRNGVTEEDMSLFEFVAVKDMAKIYQDMSDDRRAEQIWEDLKASLIARREKAEAARRQLDDLSDQQSAMEAEAARLAAEEEARQQAEAEEAEKRRRKEEKRRKKAEEAARNASEADRAAAEEAAREAERLAAEEEARLAEEEEAARAKAESKRKRREEKARRLAEEQEELRKQAEAGRKKGRTQREEWTDYVASHPLEFTKDTKQVIAQVKVAHESKPPPSASEKLLARTYTPMCPKCLAKYAKPPPEWDCPMCLRKTRQRIKTWQPDENSDACMVCGGGVGMFSRHHCRNCGRVVCGKCSEGKANIPALGFREPVKVCTDCACVPTAAAAPGATAA